MGRGKAKHTIELMDFIVEIVAANQPMTVRQVYYQCVAAHLIANKQTMYDKVSDLLVELRKTGRVPWGWIEDRMRIPRQAGMWSGLEDFADTAVKAYRRDVWETQDTLIELWCEKDALSGIFGAITNRYGVTLNVGRGYDGWTSIHDAAARYLEWDGDIVIHYFGDFDPSGEDMFRSLVARIGYFGVYPDMQKVALIRAVVDAYDPDGVEVEFVTASGTKLKRSRRLPNTTSSN